MRGWDDDSLLGYAMIGCWGRCGLACWEVKRNKDLCTTCWSVYLRWNPSKFLDFWAGKENMHFAPPTSLPRAAVGYSLASFFALSPRLIDRSRRKTLHTLQPVFKNRLKTYLFRRCYETVWLWIKFLFPSHYLPSKTVVLAIVFTV